jgi:hypothetical protein
MKLRLIFLALLIAAAIPAGRASIVYSGIQNVAIPLDFNGVYFRIDSGISTLVAPGDFNTAPWMNPFFGGTEIINGNLLRPVITGADQIVNLAPGTPINGASNFVAASSYSATHVGGGAAQFQINVPGYMGASFRQTVGGPDYYGWVQLEMNNAGAGKIISWAYENVSGGSILAGQTFAAPPVPEPGTAAFGVAMVLAAFSQRTRTRR